MKEAAALLVRVSSDVQDFSRQLSDMKALALSHGYTVRDEHVFAEKISGYSPMEQRLELTRLMNDIRDKKTDIKIIYASELSRIARNPRLARQIVDEACDLGIPFYIDGIGRTLEPDGSRNMSTSIVIQIYVEHYHKEATTAKARFKSGKRHEALKGKWAGGAWLPFGYRKEEETLLLVPEKGEAKVVKQMYQWTIDGLGMRQITSILNNQGTESRTGKPFTDVVVYQMLTNPLYKGFRRWKGELFNCVGPIVTDEIWSKAQAAMESRNNNKARNTKYLFLLDQKLWCGCCGKVRYHAKYHPRKTAYYMCYNRKFGKSKCMNAGISIDGIESLAWYAIYFGGIKRLEEVMTSAIPEQAKAKKDKEKYELELQVLERSIAYLKKQKDRTLKLFVNGHIDEDKLELDLKKLERSRDNLQLKRDTINTKLDNLQVRESKLNQMEMVQELKNNIKTDRLKMAEIIGKVVDRAVINSVHPSPSDWFVVSFWMFGDEKPTISLRFNKKTFQVIWPYEAVKQFIKYDGNVLTTDMKELVKLWRSPMKISNGYPIHAMGKTVERIPFTFVNIFNPVQTMALPSSY